MVHRHVISMNAIFSIGQVISILIPAVLLYVLAKLLSRRRLQDGSGYGVLKRAVTAALDTSWLAVWTIKGLWSSPGVCLQMEPEPRA